MSWPERWGAKQRKSGAQKGGPPKGGRPKISRFFSLSHLHFRSFSLSLCVFSWFCGGVWKRRGRQMCTFGVLGLLCEAPAAPKPPELHTTARDRSGGGCGPGEGAPAEGRGPVKTPPKNLEDTHQKS